MPVLEGMEAAKTQLCMSLDIVESERLDEPHLQKRSKNMARTGSLQRFAAVCVVDPWAFEDPRAFEDPHFSEEKSYQKDFPHR